MSEEEFENAAALEAWLRSRGVSQSKASETAPILFSARFDNPYALNGISFNVLTAAGLSNAAARTLSNKLKEQPPSVVWLRMHEFARPQRQEQFPRDGVVPWRDLRDENITQANPQRSVHISGCSGAGKTALSNPMSSKQRKSPPSVSPPHDSSQASETVASPMNLIGDEILLEIFRMLGTGHFRMVAGACHRFRKVYTQADPDCTTLAKELVLSIAGASFFCSDFSAEARFRRAGNWERPIEFVRNIAAQHGRIDMLEWLEGQEGCYFDDQETCRLAAANGHLETLQWLRARKCPWDIYTCYGAASNGHLEVLRWAVANGCWWDEDVFDCAERGGHLNILRVCDANTIYLVDLT